MLSVGVKFVSNKMQSKETPTIRYMKITKLFNQVYEKSSNEVISKVLTLVVTVSNGSLTTLCAMLYQF